jgi:hypothetical protein
MANEIVPKNALVVRTTEGFGDNVPKVGDIIKTVLESNDSRAYYRNLSSISENNWRYATALETYCFKHKDIKVTNISEITEPHKEQFKTYLKTQNHGNENEISAIETTRPNGIRPSATRVRKPTKQVAVGIRPIGNATKGKRSKERVASIILKTEAVKF